MLFTQTGDASYRIKFACYFNRNGPGTVDLLEISPDILDPGDECFYAVNLTIPGGIEGVRQVRVILVTPDEFRRALTHPSTPGGELLQRLKREQNYDSCGLIGP